MNKISQLMLVMLLGLTTACGYHLRGSIALPQALNKVYIFGVSKSLHEEMRVLLRSSRASLANSPNEAGVVIKVLKENMKRRIISVGQTGKSSEMELDYYLRFQLYDNQEKPLLEEQIIELSREFFNDQTAYLAKEQEERVIAKEIYRQAARMIMSRAEVAVEPRNH